MEFSCSFEVENLEYPVNDNPAKKEIGLFNPKPL